MTGTLLAEILVFVFAATVVVGLFTGLGLPAVVGYLAVGLIIGPYGLQLLEAGEEAVFLAELGVVLLMFMVGLEFSLPALLESRTAVLGGGSLQVGLTVLAVAAVTMLLGTDWRAAIVLGGAVAMTSTAISLKQLADQNELGTAHGRLAVGVSVYQDLATLPFLVALDVWQRRSTGPDSPLMLAFAAAAVVIAVVLSRPALRRAMAWVAGTKSADLFLLATLLFALGAAYIAHAVGLPLAIGAFLAGMVIGESDFRHQVADDIRPFRDVLLGLFFATVGMQIDPSIIAISPWLVLGWVMVFIPGKALLIWAAATLLRWSLQLRIRLALLLAHGGEFGLLLLTQAIAANIVTAEVGQPVLIALVISMLLAPLLIQHSQRFERVVSGALRRRIGSERDSAPATSAKDAEHVLICGCGRIGRLVAATLDAAKLAYLAIEYDIVRFEEARKSGLRVVFGDAGRRSILDLAGLANAKLVVITFDSSPGVERALHCMRANARIVPSLISVKDERRAVVLAQLGATAVFPENLAAGFALAHQALLQHGFSQTDAARFVTAVRRKLNPEFCSKVGV
jgi:CPA2 family monovalent cation:H+ antiporter-2